MPKVKINYFLNSNKTRTFETTGVLNKNLLTFKDEEVMFVFDIEKCILKRKNDEYDLYLSFLDNKSSLNMKKLGIININLKTKNLEKNDNIIIINYLLNEEEFNLKINYEGIEWL